MREMEIGGRQPYGPRDYSAMRCMRGEKRTILLRDLAQYEALGWKETSRPRSRLKYVIVDKKRVEATKATIVMRSKSISNDRTIQEVEDSLEDIEKKKGHRPGVLITLFVIFFALATCWFIYAGNLNGEMVTDAFGEEYEAELKKNGISADLLGEAKLAEIYGCPANASWEELSYNADVGKLVEQYENEVKAVCGEDVTFMTSTRRDKIVKDCESLVRFEKFMGYLNPNFWIIKIESNTGIFSKVCHTIDSTYYFIESEHRSASAYKGWAIGLSIFFYLMSAEVWINKAIRMRVYKSKKQYYISEAAARVEEMRENYARSAALRFNNILPEGYSEDILF